MIKYAVCDDEPLMAPGYMKEHSVITYSVSCFSSGRTLLESVGSFDLIFLNIQMAPSDGMETARLLRQRGDHSMLVFMTVLKILFERAAEHFITKYSCCSTLFARWNAFLPRRIAAVQ